MCVSTTRTTLLACLQDLRKKRVVEMVAKEVTKAKPGAWGCVQARELWSMEEDVHLRPGHHWIFEFGDAGEGSNCEKLFSLPQRRSGVVYKGTCFYHGDQALRYIYMYIYVCVCVCVCACVCVCVRVCVCSGSRGGLAE